MKLVRGWNRFWFEPRETLTIGVVRALVGFLLLCDLALLAPYVGRWFTDDGLVRTATSVAFDGPWHFSLLFIFTGKAATYIVFSILMLAAIGIMMGALSRLSCIVAYVCLLSLDHRNLVILNSGDTMLKMLVFYLCFCPCGASFSLDSLWKSRRDLRPANADGVSRSAPRPAWLSAAITAIQDLFIFGPMGKFAAPWGQRLIQIQVSIVYFFTSFDKLEGHSWHIGTALWYVYNLSEMQRFPMPAFIRYPVMINAATWGTILTEVALGLLIWVPSLRYLVILCGVLLHLGIEYNMNVPLFSAIMCTSYLSFFDFSVLWPRFLTTPRGVALASRLKLKPTVPVASAPIPPPAARRR